jgi:hypothetical protein
MPIAMTGRTVLGTEGIMSRLHVRVVSSMAALVALLVSGGAWWKY